MKKFLTVLLALSVVFTYSFSAVGSVFAAQGDTYNYTDASALVTKTADDLLEASEDQMKAAISSYTTWTESTTNTAISKEAAKSIFNDEYEAYYNAITAEAKKQQQALADGWNTNNNATFTDGSGNALDTNALTTISKPVYTLQGVSSTTLLTAEFKAVQAAQKEAVEVISTTKYADTKPAGSSKTYAEIAKDEITKALNQITGYAVTSTTADTTIASYISYIKDIYTAPVGTAAATGKLAAGGTVDTVTYTGLNNLKTASVILTDDAKIAHAKKSALATAEKVIKDAKAAVIKAQEDIIFQQEVSATPDQKIINNAKKAVDLANKQYDALLEVWKYRLENAEYKVEKSTNSADTNEYVYAYYDDVRYGKVQTGNLAVAYFDNNELKDYPNGIYDTKDINDFTAILSLTTAVEIADHVDDLQEYAEILKASVAVDGDTALAVDEALEDAIYVTYMEGKTDTGISIDTVNYELHDRIHDLIGSATKQVTVNGTKYDTVKKWEAAADNGTYDDKNADTVYGIVYDTIDALKAAKTIAEAEKIFLDAYAQYDAVMTDAEHNALFLYGGELYTSYPKAVAEIQAYIDYKAYLMGDTYPAPTKSTLKLYFADQFKDDSYNSADLAANLAAAKATVDALKTKAELTAEEAALYKEVLKVADPVKLTDKDAVVALYKKVMEFHDYAEMVGFTEKTAAVEKINKAALQLAGLEKDAIDAIDDEIMKDYKVTLADKENVEKFLAAIDDYNNLYVYDLAVVSAWTNPVTYLPELEDVDNYEDKIFDLEVKEAAKLLAALPANGATAAQLKAAREAVDALGFDGICQLKGELLTKLNRLEQNLIVDVEALKITASSTAKKGSITVKWTVKGNASAADGYQIYRSVKKNSGFGTKPIFTTAKQTYKNTKSLKKGTRYYYKVRAYKVVDGKTYYSDWSNKAYRIAK